MKSEHITMIHPPSITFCFWLVDKSVAYIYPSASNRFWVSFIKRTQPIGFLGNKRGISSPPARPEKLGAHPRRHTNCSSANTVVEGQPHVLRCVWQFWSLLLNRGMWWHPPLRLPLAPAQPWRRLEGQGGIFSLAQSQGLNPLCNPFLLIYTAAAVWRACASAVLGYNCECVCERVCPSSRPLISQSAGEDCGGPSGMWWIL